jgi:O-antigen ligase
VFAGLAVLVVLGAHRASLLISAAIVATAAIIAILALRHYPALVKNPHAGSGQEAQGHAFAGTLILLSVLAGVVQGALVAWRPSRELRRALRGVLRPVALVLAGVAALAAIGVYAVKSSAVEGVAAKGLDHATSWVDRQWQDFLRPTTFSQGGTSRLESARGTRSDLYRIALDGFLDHPLAGDGGGGYQVRYVRMRRVDEYVVNAHSLELETLDELGLVGAALLLLFVGALVFAGVRARVCPGGLSRPRAAAVTAALVVWLVHSAIDWDWQMPAVTGLALLLGAALLPYGRGRRRAVKEPGSPIVDLVP